MSKSKKAQNENLSPMKEKFKPFQVRELPEEDRKGLLNTQLLKQKDFLPIFHQVSTGYKFRPGCGVRTTSNTSIYDEEKIRPIPSNEFAAMINLQVQNFDKPTQPQLPPFLMA